MLRAIKYELNPTKAQKTLIKQSCGCCRKVYNTMLDRKISAYKENGKTLSAFDLINQLPELKRKFTFLRMLQVMPYSKQLEILIPPMLTFLEKVEVAFQSLRKKDIRIVSEYHLLV